MQRKVDEALSLARGDLDSFIVRAHAAASDSLKERFPKCAQAKTALEREEMLRNDVPIMLWHDLRRLRIIRNKIEHESFQPAEGDRDITEGTLKNLIVFLDEGTVGDSPKHRDWQAFETLAKAHFENLLGLRLTEQVEKSFPDGQMHRFDLASDDDTVLIECKSYTWTKGGNEPAAKLNHAKTDALMLKASTARRKLLVFEDDLHPVTRKSLAELFARRSQAWLGDVEVWRCLNGEFTKINRGDRHSLRGHSALTLEHHLSSFRCWTSPIS